MERVVHFCFSLRPRRLVSSLPLRRKSFLVILLSVCQGGQAVVLDAVIPRNPLHLLVPHRPGFGIIYVEEPPAGAQNARAEPDSVM